MSKIEWTEETWNPIAGCTKVSAGCKNCYAIKEAHRLAGNPNPKISEKYAGTTTGDGKNWTGRINFAPDALDKPLRWRKPRRIFVNSMSDLFHESVPDKWIDKIFAVMMLAPQHTFQVLTKRPERMREYLSASIEQGRRVAIGNAAIWTHGASWPLPNVWLGTSVENQEQADERIPLLLQTPAAVRWISAEPLLGALRIEKWLSTFGCPDCVGVAIDWVVAGGESGTGARPSHPDWFRSLRDQCERAGVPFFFKQWGAFASYTDGMVDADDILKHPHVTLNVDGRLLNFEDDDRQASLMVRVGKKEAGRILDGRIHSQFPR